MMGYVAVDIGDPTMNADEIEDLLDAAAELERQLETEPGTLVRELTQMLRRRSEFQRLSERFGART